MFKACFLACRRFWFCLSNMGPVAWFSLVEKRAPRGGSGFAESWFHKQVTKTSLGRNCFSGKRQTIHSKILLINMPQQNQLARKTVVP